MNGEKSREALIEFLEYLGEKGLMASGTVSARKAACGKLLGILSSEEASDVTVLDIDEVIHRFQNLEGKNYTSGSLQTYLSRTKGSIEEFESYLKNPLAFRPKIKPRSTKSKSKPEPNNTKKEAEKVTPNSIETVAPQPNTSRVSDTILPIPIRADLIVHIQGLPFDLTAAEANKIASVIKAMAMSNE